MVSLDVRQCCAHVKSVHEVRARLPKSRRRLICYQPSLSRNSQGFLANDHVKKEKSFWGSACLTISRLRKESRPSEITPDNESPSNGRKVANSSEPYNLQKMMKAFETFFGCLRLSSHHFYGCEKHSLEYFL